jgi:hypothetical protein
MRFLVVQDVFPKFLALNDLDIRRQTYHEAAGTLEAVDSGPEEPFAILAFEISFRQGEFLQEKALRPGIQLQDNFLVDFARHPEHIRFDGLVPELEGPIGVRD